MFKQILQMELRYFNRKLIFFLTYFGVIFLKTAQEIFKDYCNINFRNLEKQYLNGR